MIEEIKIIDGLPKGFKQMYWLNDYKEFGVMMEQLYNPFTEWNGVLFKKEGIKKSIIIHPDCNNETLAKTKFLEIEKLFDIPLEKSLYK